MRVYLAGAIENVSLTEAVGWRDSAIRVLSSAGIEVVCPIRDRLPDEIPGEFLTEEKSYQIFWHDLALIDRCDFILANLSAPSDGTAMELFYGFMGEKIGGPTWNVAFGYKRRSAFTLTAVDEFYDTLEEALECLVQTHRKRLAVMPADATAWVSTNAFGAADDSVQRTASSPLVDIAP